jgi:hypothetical protein
MFYGVYNEATDPQVLEETKRIEEFLTSDKIKDITYKDVDTKAKIDKIIYELQKEDTDKARKYLIKALAIHFVSMLGASVGGAFCVPLGAISSIVCLVHAIIMLSETKDIEGTVLERCAARLKGRIKKMQEENCDKKDIEAIKKVLDEVEKADTKNRKEGKINN